MKAIIMCLLAVAASAAMNKVMLNDAVNKGAVCLDGSAPAYYFRAATKDADKTKYVVFIQGGGWCYKESDCTARLTKDMGSSKYFADTANINGFLDENASNNPDFASWNHVYLPYCDGGSFSGNREDPVTVNGKKLYFRGFRILTAVFEDLKKNKGMDKATEVFVSGCSAGGLSTMLHADHIKEWLPKTVTRYKAAPVSGFFPMLNNANGKPVYADQLKYTFNMMNATVPKRCLAAKSDADKWQCMFSENAYLYSETPMFLQQSMYDSWSLTCEFAADYVKASATNNGNCSALTNWKCLNNKNCDANHIKTLNSKWKDGLVNIIKRNTKAGNGYFLHSCYAHCAESGNWNKYKINGVTLRNALTKWYKSDKQDVSLHAYMDCFWSNKNSCNSMC